jgi:capsular polysaccharide transport system permease protein
VSDVESTIDHRSRERAAALRGRRRRRWMTFGVVAAPVVLAVLYLAFVAVPRYSAETRFSVRSSFARPGATGAAGSMLMTGSGSAVADGLVDGWAVSDFLNSRSCMQQLDRKIDLRRYLAHGGLDVVNRLPRDAGEDSLYRAYRAAVKVSYNMMEQVNVMRVSAFSPQDSAVISQALIALTRDFVNRMDEERVTDALKVSKQTVAMAEQQAIDTRAALAAWRVQHRDIDPEADATMLLGLVSQLEAELNTAQINLDKIQALNNPDHPMLKPARMQVVALQKRLDQTRQRMSVTGSGDAKSPNSYQALKNAEAFADANLASARQTYQQALTDTLRLQRYLMVIASPVPGDRPTSPDKLVLLLESLATGFALALAVRLGAALYREFRHG